MYQGSYDSIWNAREDEIKVILIQQSREVAKRRVLAVLFVYHMSNWLKGFEIISNRCNREEEKVTPRRFPFTQRLCTLFTKS
jgi:hypothetical protein